MKECERCKGTGRILEGHQLHICPDCAGRGITDLAFHCRDYYAAVLLSEQNRRKDKPLKIFAPTKTVQR